MTSMRRVFIDLETEPIADDNRLPRPVVCGIAEETGPIRIVQGTERIITECERLLDDGATIYAHNGAHFDFPVLHFWSSVIDRESFSLWPDAAHRDRLVCTSIAAELNDIARKGFVAKDWYPLTRVCRDYGVSVALDKENPWRVRYAELEHIPLSFWPAEAVAYLRNDVEALRALAQAMPLPADTHRKTEQHFWLELSSFNGAPTDTARAEQWGDELRTGMHALEAELRAANLIDDEGKRNTKAAQLAICGIDTSELSLDEIDILAKEVNEKPPKGIALTPKGKIKTDKIACEDSDAPLMMKVAEYNSLQGTLAREWPTVMRGRVHTRYGNKVTGRTSSSDPALQNLGSKSTARACFIAEHGKHLAIADWTMLELCCLGQICIELGAGGMLAQALRDGRDIHAELAQALARAGGFGDDPKRLRRLAKEANFGRGGGMGAETLRKTARKRGLIFDLPTAQALIKVHSGQWPEIAVYHRMVQRHLDASDGVMTHYYSGRVRGQCNFTAGANTLFQGLGADVALTGFVECARAGFLPQLFVHDEYHWSLDDPGDTETIRDILAAVSKRILTHCPSRIKPSIVTNWSEKE